MATPEWVVLKRLIEKLATYELAAECGVPFPKTFFPRSLEEVREIRGRLSYPCREEGLRLGDYVKPYLAREKTFADISVRDPGPLVRRCAALLKSSV